MVGRRLVRDAAVPGRAGALLSVAAQRPRDRVVDLHVDLGIVIERPAGLGIDPLGPVEIVHVLVGLDEFAVGAVERVVEAVAPEMGDDLALLAGDRRVVEHVDADLVVSPGVVRRVLKMPGGLPGIYVERHCRVGIYSVPGALLRIADPGPATWAEPAEAAR